MRNLVMMSIVALALAVMPAVVSAQVTHTVNQVGTSFSPANLTIQVGDTVRWVWSTAAHTVTSGTGAADPDVAILFDSPLNSFSPQFEFQFNAAGSVPYFCRPHELLDMKGTIVVEDVATSSPPGNLAALQVHGVNPNPFNPRTSVSFTLGKSSPVTIMVFDMRGRLVRELLDGEQMEGGDQDVVWNGLNDDGAAVASGVYFFRVQAREFRQIVRGVLVR